jgi:hypothetical protein
MEYQYEEAIQLPEDSGFSSQPGQKIQGVYAHFDAPAECICR